MKCTLEQLAYQRAYRQRPEVKARERERALKRRAAKGGAEINRARVKLNRKKLGRAYLAELIKNAAPAPISARDIPESLIERKREALLLKRIAAAMRQIDLEQHP